MHATCPVHPILFYLIILIKVGAICISIKNVYGSFTNQTLGSVLLSCCIPLINDIYLWIKTFWQLTSKLRCIVQTFYANFRPSYCLDLQTENEKKNTVSMNNNNDSIIFQYVKKLCCSTELHGKDKDEVHRHCIYFLIYNVWAGSGIQLFSWRYHICNFI